jgi:hypothetical protein
MSFLKQLFRRPQQFRDAVVAYLRRRGDQRAVEWVDDDDELHLEVLDSHLGSGERLEFTDAFGEWKRSGDLTAATAAIDGLARPGAVTTPGFTVVARFNFGIKEDVPKLAPGLTLAAVHADEKGFETLTTEHLKALGLTFEQVAAQLAPSLFETEMPNPEVQLYEASEPGAVLARLSDLTLPPLTGEPVFILLEDDRMLITGSTDLRGLRAAAGLIHQALAEQPENRLGLCYVLRGGAWNYWPSGLRSTNRVHHEPTGRYPVSGFRCADDRIEVSAP